MQYPQTRYQDSLSTGMSNAQLTCTCALTPPTRTQGILTVGRLQGNTEDMMFTNVVGNVITIPLRGLSQTALTPTTVSGNQLVHNAGESLEITTHHNYDTDLLRKDENDNVTGSITFVNGLNTSKLQDINGNPTINTPATASAVNGVTVTNAATGNSPTIAATGTDTNVNLTLLGQGTGTVIVPNTAQNVSSAAPTTAAQLANKAYVDAQIGGISTKPTSLYAPLDQVVTDTVSAGDITANANLLYFSAGTWHKITGTSSTWYNNQLGLCLTPVTGGASGATILLQGEYTGMTFSNINPTIANSGTGTNNTFGDTDFNLVASVIDNSNGPELVISGGTKSLKLFGTPAGSCNIYLVAEQTDQAGTPACFFDTTNKLVRGAILAQASIPEATFSGTYQPISYSWGSNIKIPAGQRVYEVFCLAGTASLSNYYLVQSGVTLITVATANQSTWSGNGASLAANGTSTVVSTSPVGYTCKAYHGTSNGATLANGSWGLFPNSITPNPWAKTLGLVTSTSTFYFNPTPKNRNVAFGGHFIAATAITPTTIDNLTLGFCPDEIEINVTASNIAAANIFWHYFGFLRGDTINNRVNPITLYSNTGSPAPATYLGTFPSTDASVTTGSLSVNGSGTLSAGQNFFSLMRLENGVYCYIGYPAGASFVSAGTGTFASLRYGYQLYGRS